MATPEPFFGWPFFPVGDQSRRLRIMDNDDIVEPFFHVRSVHVIIFQVDLLLGRGQDTLLALQPVVECFGNPVKFLVPEDNPPVHIHPQILHQRHQGTHLLCHAAPERRGTDHGDFLTLQFVD